MASSNAVSLPSEKKTVPIEESFRQDRIELKSEGCTPDVRS
jgi:hypothetical protein